MLQFVSRNNKHVDRTNVSKPPPIDLCLFQGATKADGHLDNLTSLSILFRPLHKGRVQQAESIVPDKIELNTSLKWRGHTESSKIKSKI